MKTAVLYQRVSSDEQAHGHSLKDQLIRLEEYCKRNDIMIIGSFVDDYTGKVFNRPGFNELWKFAKEKKPSEILFIKWSRFGRNTAEAYVKIRDLRNMGISVQAIDEPIDFNVPQSKIMLAIHLANPEVENDIRSELTTRGIRRAAKEGRHTNGAPYGYVNQRGPDKKAMIVIEPDKAALMRKAFELLATGEYSQNQVRAMLLKEGLPLSKSRFSLNIQNPVYCGQVIVRAYKDDKEEIVQGLHEPIISESLFYKVQDVIKGRRRVTSRQEKISPDFPLKGFLYCESGHKMRASTSAGRSNRYAYYHCPNQCHCRRFQAEKVNMSFVEYLREIALGSEFKNDASAVIKFWLTPDLKEAGRLRDRVKVQEQRIAKLQDSFIDSHISLADYQQMRTRYEGELYDLKAALGFMDARKNGLNEDLRLAMLLAEDLPATYLKTPPEAKPALIGSIIYGKLYFDGEKSRTDILNPFLTLWTKPDSHFSDFHEFKESGILEHVPFSSERGN